MLKTFSHIYQVDTQVKDTFFEFIKDKHFESLRNKRLI